jgi:hypothetical protein
MLLVVSLKCWYVSSDWSYTMTGYKMIHLTVAPCYLQTNKTTCFSHLSSTIYLALLFPHLSLVAVSAMSPLPSLHQGHISPQFSLDSASYSPNLFKKKLTPKYVKWNEKATTARKVPNLETKLKIFKLGNEWSVSVIEWNNIYIRKHNCS